MIPQLMHIDLTMRVVAIVVAFFILVTVFFAIDAERVIRRLDDIRAALEALRKDDKQERQEWSTDLMTDHSPVRKR